jgi:hypothetical protein
VISTWDSVHHVFNATSVNGASASSTRLFHDQFDSSRSCCADVAMKNTSMQIAGRLVDEHDGHQQGSDRGTGEHHQPYRRIEPKVYAVASAATEALEGVSDQRPPTTRSPTVCCWNFTNR